MVENYQFGMMTVNGKVHRGDLKILKGRVIAAWWRKEGHVVDVDDVPDILAAKPEVLIIGMGQPGRMCASDALKSALSEAGIALIEEPTEDAVRTFNRLREKGGDVAGAFHLTC